MVITYACREQREETAEEMWIDLDATIDLLDENSKSSGRFPLSTFVEPLGLK